MRNLILKIHGNKYVNHTFWYPYLFIYDDIIVYRKRSRIVKVDEITLAYEHIVKVTLHKGLIFSKLEIVMPGEGAVSIKGVFNKDALAAKRIIDQKIYHVHNREAKGTEKPIEHKIDSFEKSLHRLNELVNQKKITKSEFEKKKKQLLKQIS